VRPCRAVTIPHVRRSPLILLCLLLGVITTIVLAWTCAALINPSTRVADFEHAPRADGGDDIFVIQQGFGHTRINRAQGDMLVLDETTGGIRAARWKAGGDASSETLAGWPLRALRCSNPGQITIVSGNTAMQSSLMTSPPSSTVQGGWEISPFTGGIMGSGCWRAIPLRPLWTGLALDVVIFTALWLTLFMGFAALRRRRRAERGCCPGCGYDLRSTGIAHERCPESGAASVSARDAARVADVEEGGNSG
jgi:hypothetical protein